MLKRIKGKLIGLYYQYKIKKQVCKLPIRKDVKNLFILQTPTHTNIGDHAIAEAQIAFLSNEFPNANIVEVNQSILDYFIKRKEKSIKTTDIILIHGGGNFGNQYLREENWRRKIITSFPNNKVISFPQTIYYTPNDQGKIELEKTKNIINNHSDIHLIAREIVSFDLMKTYFPKANVLITPDIVLSTNKTEPLLDREGILMVLRGDEEKILSQVQHQMLDQLAHQYFEKITYSDMHYTSSILNKKQRDEVLDFKFNQFKTAELVITDRLHGMVLAAITGTPCITFSNYNQKVSGTYEWIKHLDYIQFVQSSENIENLILELKNLESKTKYNPQIFDSYYQEIIKIIHGN